MRILERFVQGKAEDLSLCEDMIVLSDDYLAILDGATDEGGELIEGVSSGLFAARRVAKALVELPAQASANEAIEYLSGSLPSGSTKPKPQCDAIIFSRARQEVWRVGTIHLLIDNIPYPPTKRIDEITSQARAAYNQSLLMSGQNIKEIAEKDPGRELVLPLLRLQRQFANEARSEWGYGTLNGEPVPAFFLEVFPVEKGSDVVFASDGYTEALPSLHESEEVLARRLRDDPLLLRQPPATKGLRPEQISFDDRSFLRFQT